MVINSLLFICVNKALIFGQWLKSSIKKPTHYKLSGFFYALILFFSITCQAQRPTPFYSRDMNPFSLIYGLPSASPAALLKNNNSRLTSALIISNTLNIQSATNENLLVDVETQQISFLYDVNFKKNWMFRLQLPFIKHSRGFLDSAINSYHQALGLPEGFRPSTPNDQININYSRENQQLININNSQNSLGDISLQLAWQATIKTTNALSLWLSLKLPSGDKNKLTGSGASDITAWASIDHQLSKTKWLYAQGGLLYMSNSDLFKNTQKNWATFATAGLKLQPWNIIEIKAQFDFHSAFYRSNLNFLNEVIQLTFGGSYIPNKTHSIDLSVTEDIKSTASPDVNFNLSWSINF